VVTKPYVLSHTVLTAPGWKSLGVLEVMLKGAEVCWFAVAVIVMSPTAELKAAPELVIIVCDPLVAERLTLLAPAVTVHVVEEPPDEVRVIDVAHPEGCDPLKYQTVLGPEIVGLTFPGAEPLGLTYENGQSTPTSEQTTWYAGS
jgi:hypothetical protein